jgi:hypothetical protein
MVRHKRQCAFADFAESFAVCLVYKVVVVTATSAVEELKEGVLVFLRGI